MGQKVNPLGFRLGVSQKHISHWFVEKNNYSQLVVEDQFIRNFFYKNFPGIASIHIKRDLNRVVIEILSSNTRDLLMEGGKITAKATSLPAQTKNGTSASTSQGARSSGNNQIDSLCDQLLNALTAFRKTQSQTTLLKKRSFKSGSIQDSASQGEINGVPSTPSSITDNENQNLTKEQPTLEPNRATSSNMTELGPKQTSSLVDKPVEVELFLTKVENPSTSAACLAEFIVEQLEKRIPFRRVLKRSIQKAEESSVAGIKVQISGRLNGAEIARSERIHKGQVPLHTLRAKIEYNSRTAKTIYGLLGVKVWVFNGFADLNETKVLNKN